MEKYKIGLPESAMKKMDRAKADGLMELILRNKAAKYRRMPLVERLKNGKRLSTSGIRLEMERMVREKEKGWEVCVDQNGEVWNYGIICRDVLSLDRYWKKYVRKDVQTHRSLMVAEMEEVKKRGWEKDDMKTVVAGADRQIEILGLKMPERVDIKVGLEDEWARKLEAARKRIEAEDSKVIDVEVVKQEEQEEKV